jgi:arsenite-transporting ATPase
VVNQSLSLTDTRDPMLLARAEAEKNWLEKVHRLSGGHTVALPWLEDPSVNHIVKLADRP